MTLPVRRATEPGLVRRRTLATVQLLLARPVALAAVAERVGLSVRSVQRLLADAEAVGFAVVRCEDGRVMLRG